MKIYSEKTGELIESPNLEAGYTYPGRRYIGTDRVVLAGTVALYPPNGLQREVPVYEECQLYHEYTEEELEAMQTPEKPAPGDAPTWNELAAAYIEGVSLA